MRNLLPVLLLAGLAVGCPKSEEKKDDKPASKDDKKKDDGDKKKDDGDKKKDDDDKKKGDDDKKKGDDKDEAKKPPPKDDPMPERTKVPSKADFDKVADAKARGNDVGCEVRAKDEWVRVSCRKPSSMGGKPTAVWVTRGKSKDTYLYANNGVTSVVAPLLPGTDLEAKFSWADVVYSVQIRWLKGQGKPDDVAHFLKTEDKPVTTTTTGATCTCFKKLHTGEKCEDSNPNWQIVSINPWCEMSWADDCDKLIGCATGAPGGAPKCPKGMLVVYPGNFCAKECKADSACAKGEKCLEHPLMAGKNICAAE